MVRCALVTWVGCGCEMRNTPDTVAALKLQLYSLELVCTVMWCLAELVTACCSY